MSSSSSPDSFPFVSTICTAAFSAFASGVYVTLACLVCLVLYFISSFMLSASFEYRISSRLSIPLSIYHLFFPFVTSISAFVT
ncbi:hypothetical protein DFH11DRAFT_1644175, partial [Phellopilus nigrolimitatus]